MKAERERFEFDRELGRYVETSSIERELSLRARAFKLALERFGHDQAEKVAAIFGGTEESARDLALTLGVDEDKIPMLVTWAQSQGEVFKKFWRPEVVRFLDAFSTGVWWDEEMKEAWERMKRHG
ncbi:MAG: hypothetical protein KKB70_00875 [Proteobacteria bacterium]|nr:hypothetical protein [Pseudomonadota bacterium]MBU1611823.1 hypothetical protein [Pseudomonadota bacterium]